MTLNELCEHLSLKPRHIKTFRLEGMPCEDDGNYNVINVVNWLRKTSRGE